MAASPSAVHVGPVTGQPLDSAPVDKACALELEYFESTQAWEKRPYAEAMAKMGNKAIPVRWIDTNKGDEDNPNYRSRLVSRARSGSTARIRFSPRRLRPRDFALSCRWLRQTWLGSRSTYAIPTVS